MFREAERTYTGKRNMLQALPHLAHIVLLLGLACVQGKIDK